MSGVHAIISLGLHTQMNYVGHGIPSSPLDSTYNQKTLGMVLPSLPLDSTHGRTTLGVVMPSLLLDCVIHDLWNLNVTCFINLLVFADKPLLSFHHTHTVILLKNLNIGCGLQHRPWTTHTVGLSGVWHAIIALGIHINGQCQAWHAIIVLGLHTRSDTSTWHTIMALGEYEGSDDVRRAMPS